MCFMSDDSDKTAGIMFFNHRENIPLMLSRRMSQ